MARSGPPKDNDSQAIEVLGAHARSAFSAIRFNSFVGGSRSVVDIYVKLSDTHFIKVVRSGMEFDLARMSQYQTVEDTHLYVRKEDYHKFAEESLKVAGVVATSSVSIQQKMSVLLRSAEHVFTEFGDMGFDSETFDHAVQINRATLAIVESNPSIADVLEELSRCNLDLLRHSMATSILAGMMVQTLKWQGKKAIEMATLGGLLHDIGFRELPPGLCTKPRIKMTLEEVELFETHPIKGFLILKEIPAIPAEVLSIVSEHHELPSGAGFPRKIRGDKIFPLARAVAFADVLADLLVKTVNNPNPKSLKGVIDLMFHTMKHDFNDIFFEAARRLLAAELAKNPSLT